MILKRILIIVIIVPMLFSCFGGKRGGSSGSYDSKTTRGQIVGVKPTKKWNLEQPLGMIRIPSGSFVVGQNDYDFTGNFDADPRTVTVSSFFIDETEITNGEYLQFVYYTRDSVARHKLAEKAYESGGGEGISEYAYLGTDENYEDGDNLPYYQMIAEKGSGEGYDEVKQLNWEVPLYWNTGDYPDVEYAEILESMYIAPEERVDGDRFIDWAEIKYKYQWVDIKAAAKAKASRKDFIRSKEVSVYPDTTVWTKDFNYSFNEPMHEEYMWHDAYRNYPVVGVTWWQAQAFCSYRTKNATVYNKSKNKPKSNRYRLPTEFEWEYAARGGLDAGTYPWGGPYLSDDRGCYMANFKPKRGNYMEDEEEGNWIYTAEVKSFPENGFGLYDMAGNVSEWTESAYDKSGYIQSASINPNLAHGRMDNPKKVIRGGSWKDIGYYLQVASRDWEYADSATSYIGFRTVQTIPESVRRTKASVRKR
ncbi:MAG: gliding motility lipoprotein GldK [Flavobacteriales bacterium]